VSEGTEALTMIYPNPSTGSVRLTGKALQPGMATIILYGAAGNQIFSRNLQLAAGTVNLEIAETASLPPGMYMYRVTGALEGFGKFIRQ